MFRFLLIIVVSAAVWACSSAPTPPARNYELEAVQSEVQEVLRFIDNWSGFDQQYSRVVNLEEYREVERKIRSSPEYPNLKGRAHFESRTNQFDAVVERYETWVAQRRQVLEEMERFYRNYRSGQHRRFTANARPIVVDDYEIAVDNGYYALIPSDPDQAYASARSIGLKQLDIIAASRDVPLRLPTQQVGEFIVEVRITNRSKDRILRPDGYISHRQGARSGSGDFYHRSFREYLVRFSDDRNNSYQFKRAAGIINRDSDNGIRPGESMIWSYSFNRDNHPLETVRTFQIGYPKQVFGRALTLSIPMQAISRPDIPDAFRAIRSPREDRAVLPTQTDGRQSAGQQ